MKSSTVLALVSGLALASAASASVVFSDDFSSPGLSSTRWTPNRTDFVGPDNTYPITVNAAGQLALQGKNGGSWPFIWDSYVSANGDFSNAGVYTISWQESYDIRNSSYAGFVNVTLPGGVAINFSDWGNPASLYFHGTQIATGLPIGAWNTLMDYKVVVDGSIAGSTTISIFLNNNATAAYSTTLAQDANFAANHSLLFYTKFGVSSPTRIDNVLVDFVAVPEPASLSMLAAAGLALGISARKRRA